MSWSSYGDVAETYAAVAEPYYFTKPAADLVAMLALQPGERVLDLGSGSGAVSKAANNAKVVACDAAMQQLFFAPAVKVVARIPDLPFRSRAFDAIALAFVLSHLADPVAALRVMREVGGRIGVTAWVNSPSEPVARLWQSIAERFVDPLALNGAIAKALPWENELASIARLEQALREAGFVAVETVRRDYEIAIPTSRYLQSRWISLTSRFLQSRLDERQWQRFVVMVSEAVRRELGEELKFTVAVNFAVAS